MATELTPDFQNLTRGMLDRLEQAGLSDATEGSVVRTLVETFARELIAVYAQMDRVYRMGYLDTAEGAALDLVVALLGVTRRPAGQLEGLVTFRRSASARGVIAIPAGTLLGGTDAPLCQTITEALLQDGDMAVTVKVRSVEPVDKPDEADSRRKNAPILSFMARPLLGIEAIENLAGLRAGSAEETDAELRARARTVMAGSGRGTVEAIRLCALSLGIEKVRVEERGVGEVDVWVESMRPALIQDLRDAIEEVRPAGIRVTVRTVGQLNLKLSITVVLGPDRTPDQTTAIREDIKDRIGKYFDGLAIGEPVRPRLVEGLILSCPGVVSLEELRFGNALVNGKDGEILPNLTQRACLPRQDISMTLRPPTLPVLVDIDVEPVADTFNREALVARIGAFFQGMPAKVGYTIVKRSDDKEDGLEIKPTGEVSTQVWAQVAPLAAPLRTGLGARLTLVIVHPHDGRVAELRNPGDQDQIKADEVARLRTVKPAGGAA